MFLFGFCLGGGIEEEETPKEAVIREVLEETGYTVRIIKKIAEYKYRGSGKTNHVFKCKIVSGSPKTSSETKEIAFFCLENLPNPRHPVIDQWLNDLHLNQRTTIKKTDRSCKNSRGFAANIQISDSCFALSPIAIGNKNKYLKNFCIQ